MKSIPSLREEALMFEAYEEAEKENAVVNGYGNDTYKRGANFELTEDKLKAIKELQLCTYLTPPFKTAELLERLFLDPNTKANHWLKIAQNYPPRRISLTIKQMIKRHRGGGTTIDRPAAYFTYLIKFRKKRKLVGINDSYETRRIKTSN